MHGTSVQSTERQPGVRRRIGIIGSLFQMSTFTNSLEKNSNLLDDVETQRRQAYRPGKEKTMSVFGVIKYFFVNPSVDNIDYYFIILQSYLFVHPKGSAVTAH